MSSEPYTPEETILRDICVTSMRMDGAEFDRFINKVKADALRGVADDLYGGTPSIPCTQGSVNSSIRVHADRIESGDGQ